MGLWTTIAWRNIWRNPYRSGLTIAAVSIGLTALLFIQAFVEGADQQMVENYTNLLTGHLQVHAAGFQKVMELERSIADPEALEAVLGHHPEIEASARRVKVYALASSANRSAGVLLIGLDPVREPQVTRLHQRVRHGTFLTTDQDVVVGKGLAEMLDAKLGEQIVLMTQAADGSLAASAFRITGLLETGAEEIDNAMVLTTLHAAQEFLVLGSQISELGLRVKRLHDVDRVAAQLRERINPHTVEVLTWKQISPIAVQWVEFDRAFVNVILSIVLVVVAAGILNTVLMGVMERTREFGIMLALGTKPRELMVMVGLEALGLGLIGLLVGLLGGMAFIISAQIHGIELGGFSAAFEAYYTGSVIYPRLSLGRVGGQAAVVLATCVVVSLYPAWRAAHLKPIEAIRQG